jgi:hypothetical protein
LIITKNCATHWPEKILKKPNKTQMFLSDFFEKWIVTRQGLPVSRKKMKSEEVGDERDAP